MATTPTLPVLKTPEPGRARKNSLGAGSHLPRPARPYPRSIQLPRLLTLWHLTSLDAPTVAVTWCLAFAWAAHIHLPWWLPTILGLSAWSFYITDRLLDARSAARSAAKSAFQTLFPVQDSLPAVPHPIRSLIAKWVGPSTSPATEPNPSRVTPIALLRCGQENLRERHLFHWTHRRLFLPIAIAAALTALTLVINDMPHRAQTRNSVLALASLAYLTSVHARPSLRIPKELLVAIVFTAACTLPVLARTPAPYLAFIPAILTFTAIAWLNCQAIETWESTTPKPIAPLALTLATATILIAAIESLAHHPRPAALLTTAALSALLLALLDKLKSNLTPTTLRTAADLALLIPALLLAFQ